VILAEAEIPLAISSAFRNGQLGVMDITTSRTCKRHRNAASIADRPTATERISNRGRPGNVSRIQHRDLKVGATWGDANGLDQTDHRPGFVIA